MELEFEEGDDGIEVILTVRGERFYHTISFDNSSQSNGDYYAYLNLTLAQDPRYLHFLRVLFAEPYFSYSFSPMLQ